MDLTNIVAITFDQFFVEGEDSGLSVIVIIDLIESVFTDSVEITWADSNGPLVAFIDNITLHPLPEPLPEPSSLALLAFSIAALMIGRRRIG